MSILQAQYAQIKEEADAVRAAALQIIGAQLQGELLIVTQRRSLVGT